jgi:serine/threonine protein kinase
MPPAVYTVDYCVAVQPFITPSTALDRRRLGKFEVLCRLSSGGMSQIYLATQSGIGGFKKLVVLKTILPDIGGEEDFVRMFLEEARTTAAFNHPNIAQVYELDVDAGELFMAMEFVQGCTLVEMAKACRTAREPIPVGFSLQSVRDTALALHYAHNFTDARGRRQIVIHRDVAEKNIMVTYEGVTKLLDFGIAKALGRSSRTNIGMVKGTSGYMSPEQIRGEPLDSRSDIFSLGVVLHECLTGLRLFHGKNAEEGMLAALNSTIAPPSRNNPTVTAEVDAVAMRALQRKREDRFNSCLEFARAIEKAAPGIIWHPEQSAELVSRHFADRRAETRRILETTNFGGDNTGEIRIDSLMQRVRTSGAEARASIPTVAPLASASPPPIVAPPVPPAIPAITPPSGVPNSLRIEHRQDLVRPENRPQAETLPPDPDTNPEGAQPAARSSATAAPPAGPIVVTLDPPSDFDADDSEAKTIPAAELPQEIKMMRTKLAENKRASRATEPVPAHQPSPQSVFVAADTPPMPADHRSKPLAPNLVKTSPPTSSNVVLEGSTSGSISDAQSIVTGEVPQWPEEEPEAKTAVGLPFEQTKAISRKPSPPTVSASSNPVQLAAQQTNEDEDDERDTMALSTKSTTLVAVILVPLFVAAVLAVLYAANLPPFASDEGTNPPLAPVTDSPSEPAEP